MMHGKARDFIYTWQKVFCERFEPRSHFKSRLSLIVRVNVVLNRTVVVDSNWCFHNLCGSHLQSQSKLYHVSRWYYTLVIDLIGQLLCNVIGRLSVKPWPISRLLPKTGRSQSNKPCNRKQTKQIEIHRSQMTNHDLLNSCK